MWRIDVTGQRHVIRLNHETRVYNVEGEWQVLSVWPYLIWSVVHVREARREQLPREEEKRGVANAVRVPFDVSDQIGQLDEFCGISGR
jgi:hypothetical protein